ncbi:hypothetical protein [Coleofasciculus sp. E2-BRE-01]|jgi:hypothetical protein|uniref:hypothetical protein n=1 Tax=Coleofasciculus sp. E2-BRE-01 TaxID=3069524 RepID=UPI0033008CDC
MREDTRPLPIFGLSLLLSYTQGGKPPNADLRLEGQIVTQVRRWGVNGVGCP